MTDRRRAELREKRSEAEQGIADAVEALLVDHSFRDLTVEDVMAVAGMSRTAFYRYFTDLDAVLLRCLGDVAEQLSAAASIWLDPEAEPVATLWEGAEALAEVFLEHGRVLRALADAAGTGSDVEAAYRATIVGFVGLSEERIRSLVDAGLASVDDIRESAVALVWMTERYLLETYGKGGTVPVEVAGATLAHIWHAALFGARQGRPG